MPEQADNTWADMVRRHAEVAEVSDDARFDSDTESDASADAMPEHRPTAAILACSDARVPPTLLFDQEPGSLFVVRIAGNSATPGAVASLTYAVEALGTDLIVVLGHTGCGAVAAALAPAATGDLATTLAPVLTPIDEMLLACETCDGYDAAVAANVRHNIVRLERDHGPLGRAVAEGRVALRGAVHDLATGRLIDVSVPTSPTHSPSTTNTTPTTPLIRSAT